MLPKPIPSNLCIKDAIRFSHIKTGALIRKSLNQWTAMPSMLMNARFTFSVILSNAPQRSFGPYISIPKDLAL